MAIIDITNDLDNAAATEAQPEGLLLPQEGEQDVANQFVAVNINQDLHQGEEVDDEALEDDDEDIIKTAEDDEDWVLIDKVRPIKSFRTIQPGRRKKNYFWQLAADGFYLCGEICNAGIFIKIVENWFPIIQTLSGGVDVIIETNADPLIYFFRFLTRVVRIVGREFFGIILDDEEKDRAHPHLTTGDMISGALLASSIPLFFGLIIPPALGGIVIAWSLAMAGMWTIFYYDYVYPTRKAFMDFQQAHNEGHSHTEIETAFHDYKTLEVSRNFYFVTLMSVMLLAITHAAIPVAPLIIVPVLTAISTIAGSMAAIAFVARVYNQHQHDQYHKGLKAIAEADEKALSLSYEEGDTLSITAKLKLETKQAVVAQPKGNPRPLVIPPETSKWVDSTIGTPRGGMNRNHLFHPPLKLDLTNVDVKDISRAPTVAVA